MFLQSKHTIDDIMSIEITSFEYGPTYGSSVGKKTHLLMSRQVIQTLRGKNDSLKHLLIIRFYCILNSSTVFLSPSFSANNSGALQMMYDNPLL